MKIRNDKKWYSMSKAGNTAEIMIYNDIGSWGITAENFAKSLSDLGEVKNITLRINSYGGEVFDGFAIYNRLKQHEADITVIVDGIAGSIVSVIAMSGNKIKMPNNAFFMIHNPAVFISGTSKDLKNAAALLDELKEKAIDAYMTKTNLTREEISNLMDEETWIDSNKSIEYALADEIIDPVENDEPATNRNIHLPENFKEVFLSANKQKPAGMKTPVMKGEKMNKCPHCGKDISEGSVFCNHCGERIVAKTEPLDEAIKRERQEAKAEAEKAERERIKNIRAACTKFKLEESFVDELIDSGKPLQELNQKILDKISLEPVPPNNSKSNVQFGVDEAEKFVEHASNCLAIVSGVEKNEDVIKESKKDVFINGLHTLMRVHLEKRGISHASLDANGLVEKSFQMIGSGISDLPAALEATVNKSMKRGFEEAPTTYQIWTGRREVNDFKTNSIYQVSNFGDLKDMADGSDFEDAVLADSKETFSISTKGRKFTIGRQAFINDDVDAYSKVPMTMGRAAGRRINKDVYDGIASNSLAGPAMTDTKNLFDTTYHHNVKATSGVVSVSSIDASEKLLMEMPLLKPEPDSATQYQGLTGRYIVTGTAKRLTVLQVLGTPYDISKSIVGVVNPYNLQNLTPVFDPYLQSLLTAGSKANAWYHVADQMDSESVGVAFLRGNTTPTMRRAMSSVGQPLGIVFDIYFDWGIYYADWRGIIYNDGAS